MRALRWIVLVVAALVLVGGLWIATRLSGSDDVTQLLPTSDPMVADALLVLHEFRQADSLFLDVGLDDAAPLDRAAIQTGADLVNERLAASGLFADIRYRVDQGMSPELPGRLQRSLPGLLGAEDMAALESRLTPEALAEHLEDMRVRLAQPEGIMAKHMLQHDPLELTGLWTERLTQLAQPAGGVEIRDGRIWSRDGRRILLIAHPKFPPADTVQDGRLLTALDALRGELRGSQAGLRLRAVGAHVATYDNATTMKYDIWRASVGNTVAIVLLGALTFRRRHYVLLMFLPTIWGVALACAAYSLWASDVAMVTVGSGVALVGLAVDYGIQVLFRADHQPWSGKNPWARVRRIAVPITLASATSCAAMACLLLSPLPGQRQMGLLGGIGIFGAAAFSLIVLPLLIRPKPLGRHLGAVDLSGLSQRFMQWRDRHGLVLFVVQLAFIAGAAVGISRLRLASDLADLNHLAPAHQQDQAGFNATWQGLGFTTVVTSGPTLEAAQQAAERVNQVLQGHVRAGRITWVASPTAALPSRQTQDANYARWRAYWTDERRRTMQARLDQAASAAGFAPRVFAPFQESWTAPPEVLDPAILRGTPLDSLLATYTAANARQHFVLSTFQVSQRGDLPNILRDLRAQVPAAIVLDPPQFAEHIGELIRTGLWRMALLGFLVMIPILWPLLGRMELVLITLLPALLSAVVTLGLLGWLGVPINLMSSLFILVIFGMGIDYSIYLVGERLVEHRRQGKPSAVPFGAVVLCSLTALAGFFFLAIAQHTALRTVGLACFLGILTSSVFAVLLLPVLLDYFLPRDARWSPVTFRSMFAAVYAGLYLFSGSVLYLVVLRWYYCLRYRDLLRRQRAVRTFLRHYSAGLLFHFPFRGSKVVLQGFDVAHPPRILVANHQSVLDIFVMLSLPLDLRMVAKPWVWKAPLIGPLVRGAGFIGARPEEYPEVLKAIAASLREGVSVVLFPEGTRSMDGTLGRFHSGAFRAAGHCRCAVQAVVIANILALTGRAIWSFNAGRALIAALPPVDPPGGADPLRWTHWANATRRLVQERQEQLVRAAYTGPGLVDALLPLYRYQGRFVESYLRNKLRLDPMTQVLDRLVPESGTIVDAGCGYGALAHLLARLGPRRQVWGVDFDLRKIAAAKARADIYPNLRFLVRDLARWRFCPADGIVLIDALHYWSKPRQDAILDRIASALRPGGVLVFRETVAETAQRGGGLDYWSERILTALGHNRAGDRITFRSKADYLQAFTQRGLVLIDEPADAILAGHWAAVLRKEAPHVL